MKIAVTSTGPTLDDNMRTGFGVGNWPAVEQPASPSESDVDPAQARVLLQNRLQVLEQQRHQIEQSIR